MPAKKSHSQRKVLLKAMFAVIIFILAIGLAGLFIWAKEDLESPLAAKVRAVFGLPDPVKQAESPVEPEPAPEPEPEPAPEPEITPPTPPEPVALDFEGLARRSDLWPRALELTVETRVPIRFNGNDFGHLEFLPGQELVVDSMVPPDRIGGSVGGIQLTLQASQTTLEDWFTSAHSENYVLVLDAANDSAEPEQESEGNFRREALLAEMRYWCYRNYDLSNLEVTDNNLVLYWQAKNEASVDYRVEARHLARHYLSRQSAFGGSDNFAACEIRHPKTKELLGAGSVYLLSLYEK